MTIITLRLIPFRRARTGFIPSIDQYDVETEGTGIAVRRDDDGLQGRLNDALSAVLADGTYQEIDDRHFDFGIY